MGPLKGGTLCGIEKLIFYIRVVNSKVNVTIGNWVEHWIWGLARESGRGGGVRKPSARDGLD